MRYRFNLDITLSNGNRLTIEQEAEGDSAQDALMLAKANIGALMAPDPITIHDPNFFEEL